MNNKYKTQNMLTIFLFCVSIGFIIPIQSRAEETSLADVVVIVDTSTSMKDAGMDPERSSLLVTKLLADIVPGELAVVRLLGMNSDKELIPSTPTGKEAPCSEDVKKTCTVSDPKPGWSSNARKNLFGVLSRGMDSGEFKKKLEGHLKQTIANSMFDLSFQAALGVFDAHPKKSHVPRMVIWLSDGRSDRTDELEKAINEVKSSGASIEAIVFGKGDKQLAKEAGVKPVFKASNPSEIMKAFADTFRRIVQAPFKVDGLVNDSPSFEMKPNVHEAWVIVYGDKTLAEAYLDSPNEKNIIVDYAADKFDSAGAYRVAYFINPKQGTWHVHVNGGGSDAAYAVIQRSELMPYLLDPKTAFVNTSKLLVVGVKTGLNGEPVNDKDLIQDAKITAEIEGNEIKLVDDGTQGDAQANDGHFSGIFTFSKSGEIPVKLELISKNADRSANEIVSVQGEFSFTNNSSAIDLGSIGVASESCRPLMLSANKKGKVPLELRSLNDLPIGQHLEIRTSTGNLYPNGNPIEINSGETFQVCLKTDELVGSSSTDDLKNKNAWLKLRVANSEEPDQQFEIQIKWDVKGLTDLKLYLGLFLKFCKDFILIFASIISSILTYFGIIKPKKFDGSLAVTFVPNREELDEQLPQPVKQWNIGFRVGRNSRAYFHADYRLSGKFQGALAYLEADDVDCRVMTANGNSLYKETIDGEWEILPTQGARGKPGYIYRIGMNGPYFRIAVRG